MITDKEKTKRLILNIPEGKTANYFVLQLPALDEILKEEQNNNLQSKRTLRFNGGGIQDSTIDKGTRDRFKAELRGFIEKFNVNVPVKFTGFIHIDFDGNHPHRLIFEMKESQFEAWRKAI